MGDRRNEHIISGFIDGEEYSGMVVESMPGLFMASLVKAELQGFGEGTTGTFSDFEKAKQFVLNEWSKLQNK